MTTYTARWDHRDTWIRFDRLEIAYIVTCVARSERRRPAEVLADVAAIDSDLVSPPAMVADNGAVSPQSSGTLTYGGRHRTGMIVATPGCAAVDRVGAGAPASPPSMVAADGTVFPQSSGTLTFGGRPRTGSVKTDDALAPLTEEELAALTVSAGQATSAPPPGRRCPRCGGRRDGFPSELGDVPICDLCAYRVAAELDTRSSAFSPPCASSSRSLLDCWSTCVPAATSA